MVDSTQSIRKRFDGKEYERRSHAEKRRLVQALMRSVRKPSLSGREKMPGRSLTVIQRTGMQYRAECGRFVRIQVVTRSIFRPEPFGSGRFHFCEKEKYHGKEKLRAVQKARQRLLRHPRSRNGRGHAHGGARRKYTQAQHRQSRPLRLLCAGRGHSRHDL